MQAYRDSSKFICLYGIQKIDLIVGMKIIKLSY